MLIYFDESYDNERRYLILGALFNPHPRAFHQTMTEIKQKHGLLRPGGDSIEIKYSTTNTEERFRVCSDLIQAFARGTSWFRCVVIDQSLLTLDRFGTPSDPDVLKMARAYKRFCELLISSNTRSLVNGVLLCDRLTRCSGDRFIEVMKEAFSVPNHALSLGKGQPTLREIKEVDSHLDHYQVLQLCDLLTGCVLNSLVPGQNRWKATAKKCVQDVLKFPSFERSYWTSMSKGVADTKHPKFGIWYWTPGMGEQNRPGASAVQAVV